MTAPRETALFYSGITDPAVPLIAEQLIHDWQEALCFLVGPTPQYVIEWVEALCFFHKLFKHAGISENLDFCVRARKHRSQNRSVCAIHEDSSTELTPLSRKKMVSGDARKAVLQFALLPETTSDESETLQPPEWEYDRIDALTRLLQVPSRHRAPPTATLVIGTTPQGLFQPAPDPQQLEGLTLTLKPGQCYPLQQLVAQLNRQGYDFEPLCESPGQFAVRGGIVDVYPVNANGPVRIDFFGDEIETIRSFDPTTQRSTGTREKGVIAPALSALTFQKEGLFLYLKTPILWILRDPEQLHRATANGCREETMESHLTSSDLFERRRPFQDRWCGLGAIDIPLFSGLPSRHDYTTEPLHRYRKWAPRDQPGLEQLTAEKTHRLAFFETLKNWQKQGDQIYCVLPNHSEAERARALLTSVIGPVPCVQGPLTEGFRIRGLPVDEGAKARSVAGSVFVSQSEIFGNHRTQPTLLSRRRRLQSTHSGLDFSELTEGDWVVHAQHGIATYHGLKTLDLQGRCTEVLTLEFDKGALLHLPLHEAHLLSRYVGLNKKPQKRSRLGSHAWSKARYAAEAAALDFAAQLLQTQAQRKIEKGHAFAPDNDWQKTFEETFLYEATQDQLSAIEVVKADMEKPHPMDRLLCGDVGFGKTEVVLRAAFKTVMDGKQVAVLAPTTVLVQQHFNTFQERMASYAVHIAMLSRFCPPQQQREILKKLRSGQVDIVIGTHRLLSDDVAFRDMGLLVVDEEHRFGVRGKERIKRLYKTVDVLSLSATPIPRTLYMALAGARDMSVIETPPTDRLPIQTFIKTYHPDIVKKAIQTEINRGGQVFYLHNRIHALKVVAKRLREQLPDSRITIAHGSMEERQLEEKMTDFVAGKYDVLVSTTIIESGIDIPNSNTIIIENADRFGLSQLHQLRGRVGRCKRQAYAYLLIQRSPDQATARKRLEAIYQFQKLGSGFHIALRDLELRGAGNLLGPQQSGHIAGVGFDLYCQLMRQSIARLKGEPEPIRTLLRLDFIVWGEAAEAPADGAKRSQSPSASTPKIEAYIPCDYIEEPNLRLDGYRRLASALTVAQVQRIREDFEDRFGTCPEPVKVLLLVTEVRCLAQERHIDLIETEGPHLKCHLAYGATAPLRKALPDLTAQEPLLKLKEIRSHLLLCETAVGC